MASIASQLEMANRDIGIPVTIAYQVEKTIPKNADGTGGGKADVGNDGDQTEFTTVEATYTMAIIEQTTTPGEGGAPPTHEIDVRVANVYPRMPTQGDEMFINGVLYTIGVTQPKQIGSEIVESFINAKG